MKGLFLNEYLFYVGHQNIIIANICILVFVVLTTLLFEGKVDEALLLGQGSEEGGLQCDALSK